MEISTSPHRPAPTPWGRLLVLVVILGPVTVLVLLPIGLGLERYVLSGDSMDGGISRGSVVFERAVPVGDLRVGDVITYRAPASSGTEGLITHRIVDIGPDGIRTQGDANPTRDPWTLRPDQPTVPRVVFALPWVGYAYPVILHAHTWLLLFCSLAILGVLLSSEMVRRRRADPATPDVPERVGEPAACGGTRRTNSGD
ncbi:MULTISPECIES: signal peptidase I [unclassified Nocardioides]|uniref:signal peptidase I n=1 Tax=unclassified Nocardioides TaxID=2615069 RepID=UPI000A268104|nr:MULTISPECIES: signal peptidase I [unclassified Nocardioides]